MATDEEAISNKCVGDTVINVIKSIWNMKKLPDCSSICSYISKLYYFITLYLIIWLSNSDITEEIVLNRLHYPTVNNKTKNKPTNGRDSY